MFAENFDSVACLRHLISSPTEYQTYIHKLWNELHFGKKKNENFTSTEILNRNLKFLHPFHSLLSSPFGLPDMEIAIEIIHEMFHKRHEKKVLVFADRDADGICSASILYLFFRDKMGIPENNITLMLPEVEDKYGITLEIADKILQNHPDILITLDNGSSNKESFEYILAKAPQLKSIVIDHHSLPKSKEDYPRVDAFINPVILEEKNSRRHMCTSGLAYLFIYAIAYSFTKEYNKVTLFRNDFLQNVNNTNPDTANSTEDVYIKNGLSVDSQKYDKIFYQLNAPDINSDFNLLWSNERKIKHSLAKIDSFLQTFPYALNIQEKFFVFQNIKMQNVYHKIHEYLPLAAIGTIADSMLLVDENRILVYEGLNLMNQEKSKLIIGLREIIKIMDLTNTSLTEQDLAFTICPAVNAAGRMGQAKMALDALVVKDPVESARHAFLLKEQNEKRKLMSSNSMKLLDDSLNSPDDPVVVCYHPDIHRGISGIIASKLAEKNEKPALVLVNDGEYLRGSIRSYRNENVLAIIHELSSWFVQYGGHVQAAGFSLEHSKRENFVPEFVFAARNILSQSREVDFETTTDCPVIQLKDIELRPSLWKELLAFAPYGSGNPRPKLSVRPTNFITYKLMGKEKNHAKVNFTAIKNSSIEAVWFNFGKDLYNLEKFENLKIIAEPQINYFRGSEKYQLRITEILV